MLERDLLFRKSAISVAEGLHVNAANLFELVKNKSKTYGELQNNLNKIVKDIGWNDRSVGEFLSREFQKLYEEDIRSTLTQTFTEKEVHCITQHFATFHEQCKHRKKADFGEPCAQCVKNRDCNLDWLSNVEKFLDNNNIKFSLLVDRERLNKQDSDHNNL